MGLFGSSGTSAGELQITNMDNQSHTIVIHGIGNRDVSETVRADSSQTITLYDSPGNYTVNATIDGEDHVNTTIEYAPGGESGEKLAGPGLELRIRSSGNAFYSRSYD